MMQAFTPGPWSVGPSHVIAQRRVDGEGRRTTRFVAEAVLSAPHSEEEGEANARLIAAAPELYEALTACIEQAIGCARNHYAEQEPAYGEHIAKGLTALAKARGEQVAA